MLSRILCLASFAAVAQAQTTFVVPAGQTVVYDTGLGPINADYVRIETGATLRAVGAQPLKMYVSQGVLIDGTLDVSGANAQDVATLHVPQVPAPGAVGVAGGGNGGTGSPSTTMSDASGGNGFGPGGGFGGETGWNASSGSADMRRGAGGGGGRFGPDEPVVVFPLDPLNIGRIALPGMNGAVNAFGALSGSTPPHGGAFGATPFVDANGANDFFGHARDPLTGAIIVGELASPRAGAGGGAGGDSVQGSFPSSNFTATDNKGAGGGAGGGLSIIVAKRIRFGATGLVLANGGDGAGGENTIFLNRVAGGSGGGSGGMVILQARQIDLSHATDRCVSALGGRGGQGKNNAHDVEGAGGNGGPGLIQLHTTGEPRGILLPIGMSLSQLTAPTARVCLLEPGL